MDLNFFLVFGWKTVVGGTKLYLCTWITTISLLKTQILLAPQILKHPRDLKIS